MGIGLSGAGRLRREKRGNVGWLGHRMQLGHYGLRQVLGCLLARLRELGD